MIHSELPMPEVDGLIGRLIRLGFQVYPPSKPERAEAMPAMFSSEPPHDYACCPPPPPNSPHKIAAGDVVQLKSGGPAMTVSRVYATNGFTVADVVWFDPVPVHSDAQCGPGTTTVGVESLTYLKDHPGNVK